MIRFFPHFKSPSSLLVPNYCQRVTLSKNRPILQYYMSAILWFGLCLPCQEFALFEEVCQTHNYPEIRISQPQAYFLLAELLKSFQDCFWEAYLEMVEKNSEQTIARLV